MKTTLPTILVFLVVIVLFAGCAESEAIDACLKGRTYGFFGGIMHGFIAPFSLITMIFDDEVVLFAQNNNGFWYAFGFLLGSGGWGLMGGHSARKKS